MDSISKPTLNAETLKTLGEETIIVDKEKSMIRGPQSEVSTTFSEISNSSVIKRLQLL